METNQNGISASQIKITQTGVDVDSKSLEFIIIKFSSEE